MAMAAATRWWAIKRAITRAARAIVMAMIMSGNKEGNGKGARAMAMEITMAGDEEGNGNCNNNSGRQRG